jgi:hypothetical protein
MTEVVVAVFDASPSADSAIRDLEAARIPSAVIRRFVNANPEQHIIAVPLHGAPGPGLGSPMVSVVVDEVHAPAVEGILENRAVLATHASVA